MSSLFNNILATVIIVFLLLVGPFLVLRITYLIKKHKLKKLKNKLTAFQNSKEEGNDGNKKKNGTVAKNGSSSNHKSTTTLLDALHKVK